MGEMSEEIVNEMKQKFQNVQQAVKTVQDIYSFFKKESVEPTETQSIKELLNNDLRGFNFTGQTTDLCYFQQADRMPLSAIANIQDPQLKKAVIDNLDVAINEKMAYINGDCLMLTDKGKELINTPDFQQVAQVHQSQAYNQNMGKLWSAGLKDGEIQMGAALRGDYLNDFTFFSHADKLDLNTILSHPNRELSSKILSNVKGWADTGLVSVDPQKGIAMITDIGKNVLNSPAFKAVAKPMANQAIATGASSFGAGVATASVGAASGAATAGVGTIVVATVKVLGDVGKKLGNVVQTQTVRGI